MPLRSRPRLITTDSESAVLFEDARIVPELDVLAGVCAARGIELLIDAYHALGAVPFLTPATAWVVGGGYKYLQLGEGNCFIRIPAHRHDARPAVTGWFAEFEALSDVRDQAQVAYPRGAAAFSGSTYDRPAITGRLGFSTSSPTKS